MTDYIKRDDALYTIECSGSWEETEERIKGNVYCPSADVEPVRHGRWEKNDDYTCSLCGYRMVVGDGAYRYCPNCGAKMDEEE